MKVKIEAVTTDSFGTLDALAQAMMKLMEDEALRADLGARAKEVSERLGQPLVMTKWDHLIA